MESLLQTTFLVLETHLGTREEMRRCRPGPPFPLTSAERDQSQEPAGLALAHRWGSAETRTALKMTPEAGDSAGNLRLTTEFNLSHATIHIGSLFWFLKWPKINKCTSQFVFT